MPIFGDRLLLWLLCACVVSVATRRQTQAEISRSRLAQGRVRPRRQVRARGGRITWRRSQAQTVPASHTAGVGTVSVTDRDDQDWGRDRPRREMPVGLSPAVTGPDGSRLADSYIACTYRPVASQPGGGGSELGWVEHRRGYRIS